MTSHEFSFDYNEEEIHALLNNGDSISFSIPRKCKHSFKKQVERINKTDSLLRRRKGFLSRLWAYLYFIYAGISGFITTFNRKELRIALVVYETSWIYISTFHGEDISDEKTKVTYNGKSNNNGGGTAKEAEFL